MRLPVRMVATQDRDESGTKSLWAHKPMKQTSMHAISSTWSGRSGLVLQLGPGGLSGTPAGDASTSRRT